MGLNAFQAYGCFSKGEMGGRHGRTNFQYCIVRPIIEFLFIVVGWAIIGRDRVGRGQRILGLVDGKNRDYRVLGAYFMLLIWVIAFINGRDLQVTSKSAAAVMLYPRPHDVSGSIAVEVTNVIL